MKVFIYTLREKATKEPYTFITTNFNKDKADITLEKTGLLKTKERWRVAENGLWEFIIYVFTPFTKLK